MKPVIDYLEFEALEHEFLSHRDHEQRQLILRVLVDYPGGFTRCEMSGLLRLLRDKLNGSATSALSKKQHTALKHFLTTQRRHFGVEFELKTHDPKPSRLEVIPTTANYWAALPVAQDLLERCRKRKLRRTSTIELATRLTYELMALGYGFKSAVWVVCALKVDDLQRPNIAIPSRPAGLPFGFHEFVVTENQATLLQRLHQITRGQKQVNRFEPTDYAISSRDDQEPDDSAPLLRFARFQRAITRCHRQLLKETSNQPLNQHPLRTRKALEEVYGTLATLQHNLEPAFVYRLRHLPFPNDAVGGMGRFLDVSHLNSDYQSLRTEFCTHSLPTRRAGLTIEPGEEITEPILDFDNIRGARKAWLENGYNIVEALIDHLRQDNFYSESSKLQSPEEQERLTEFTAQYLASLDDKYRYSICAIAIEYMTARLKRNVLQIKTAVQTLRAAITHGALRYEDADDLRNWDDDDIEVVMEYIRIGAHGKPRAPSTIRAIQSTLISMFIFAQKKHGLLSDITLISTNRGLLQRYFRNDPWTPGEFEQHYIALGNSNRPDRKREQIIMALAYWGGMRPKEIRHLSLVSIETPFDEINLFIRSTKTVNGRRRIPLHLLAPDNILDDLRDYIRTRREKAEKFTGIAQKQIALIGLNDSPHALRREVLTDGITQYLRERGGDHMDLYCMRHSFATLTLLRWQVYSEPKTISLLRIRNHLIFTTTYQQRFAQLFSRSLIEQDEREKVNTLIQIRRLMGHGHLSVTLENYTHCFGALMAIRQRKA